MHFLSLLRLLTPVDATHTTAVVSQYALPFIQKNTHMFEASIAVPAAMIIIK